ncbi:MAG TPA: O-antigen ligase family protein [Thermoanaerobaculia bacterium]|nr:O-antigen ligase family protein [Thermoanaerobaculia bacterium]
MTPPPRTRTEPRLRGPGFFTYALHVWTIFGIALSNIFLAIAVLLFPWAVRRWRAAWCRFRPAAAPLGFYFLFLAASVAFSYDLHASVGDLGQSFALMTLVLGIALLDDDRRVEIVVTGLCAVGGLIAAYGLGQLFLGYGDLQHRIRGPFSHYMTFAGVLLICDFFLLGEMLAGGKARSLWRWLALLLINAALLASLTRSAWVGLAVALTFMLLVSARRLLWIYIPAVLLIVLLAPRPVLQRVTSIGNLEDVTSYDRLCMLEAGLKMIRERPLFGIGPNLVAQRYPIYRQPSAPRIWVPHLHDAWLEIAAERGLLSLGAYLWLTVLSLRTAYRGYRGEGDGTSRRRGWFAGALFAVVAFNLAGLFENNWGDAEVQRLALFALCLPFALSEEEPSSSCTTSSNPSTD